jgi:hypothetical protein
MKVASANDCSSASAAIHRASFRSAMNRLAAVQS